MISLLIAFFVVIASFSLVVTTNAEKYTYNINMTQEQLREERLLPLCYTQNGNEWAISILNSSCWNFYGGPVS